MTLDKFTIFAIFNALSLHLLAGELVHLRMFQLLILQISIQRLVASLLCENGGFGLGSFEDFVDLAEDSILGGYLE